MNQMTRTLLLLAMVGVLAVACKKEESTLTVTTDEVIDITSNSALCRGKVVDRHVTKYDFTEGFCWSTTSKPTASDSSYSSLTNGGNSYAHTIKWLTGNTTYYVRAYATNSAGTVYGSTVSFTTLPSIQPEIKNAYPTYVTRTTAQLEGEVTSDGGAPVTARGVCWSTGENPTVVDSKTEDGAGQGKYTSMLTGLTANTTYYARAYATNTVGTTYGSNILVRTMYGTVTDIDGNVYQTVLIGTQEWMAENLKVTHYSNGDPIPNITDNTQWANATSGAWCIFNNDPENKNTRGLLYNCYTVTDSRRVCPDGWHVSNDSEWTILTNYLGGEEIAGYKLKKAEEDVDADNASGFSALMGGYFAFNIGNPFVEYQGIWWTATRFEGYWGCHYIRQIYYNEKRIIKVGYPMIHGVSIRCLKDN